MLKAVVSIPCFNEGRRFPAFARGLSAPPGVAAVFAVVDDGSAGEHQALLEAAVRELNARGRGPEFRYLRSSPNRGKGYAIRRGWAWAEKERPGADYFGFCDADGAVPAAEVTRFLSLLAERRPAALAAVRSAARPVRRTLLRKAASFAFGRFVGLVLGLRARDTQCGLKFLSAGAYAALAPRLSCDRYGLDLELLYGLRRLGLETALEPVDWTEMGDSKVSLLRDSLPLAADALGLWLRSRRLPKGRDAA